MKQRTLIIRNYYELILPHESRSTVYKQLIILSIKVKRRLDIFQK